jgi:hypothetical protein
VTSYGTGSSGGDDLCQAGAPTIGAGTRAAGILLRVSGDHQNLDRKYEEAMMIYISASIRASGSI